MSNYEYQSILASHINSFLKIKKTMGFGLQGFKDVFKEIDIICIKEGLKDPVITQSLIAIWRTTRINDSNRTLYDKYSRLSQFSRYMCHIGCSCYVPRLPKRNFGDFIPYIFTHEQMNAIFHTCDSLRMSQNHMDSKLFAMPAILRLLYSTGLRVGEAIYLKNSDVDLKKDIILIRKTKNQQQRLIPINSTMKQILKQYIKARDAMPLRSVDAEDAYFFISPAGVRLNRGNVYAWFKKILKICGIPHIGKNHGPRVHDLRHTFATHSLIAQVKSGVDIYCVLPILSIFLGHKTLAGTEKYVRLTQEMYPDIINMEHSISSFIFPSMPKIVTEYEKE